MSDEILPDVIPNVAHLRDDDDGDNLAVGQWYWTVVKDERWLGCLVHIGSNYVQVQRVGVEHFTSVRIHLDEFHKHCVEPENEPNVYIGQKVEEHRHQVQGLMGRVKQLCAKFGLTPAGALPAESSQTSGALVVAHGVSDIQKHRSDLVKAKEETLPNLFKEIEKHHRQMANWMKAELAPLKANENVLKAQTRGLEDQIFTVDLYAGLSEELVLLRDGKPAPDEEKIRLYQRRHYMDEECLLQYESGGMDFRGIGSFDQWLMKDENRERILPKPRCIVAFRVRRHNKEREVLSLSDLSLSDFITFQGFDEADKWTFLYLRNGDRYFRLSTTIEFGERLFPDIGRSKLLGGEELYIMPGWTRSSECLITERELIAKREKEAKERAKYEDKLAAWKKADPKARGLRPHLWLGSRPSSERYEPLNQDSVYYDDAMAEIHKAARDHNRVSVVLQGLLDRSTAFQPHPPWRLWTIEGFQGAVELIYNDSRGLVAGEKPDFEAFRKRLNATLKRGSKTVGQEYFWLRREAKKENDRRGDSFPYTTFQPYGNPGPGVVAEVSGMSRDKTKVKFTWERKRLSYGYDRSPIRCHLEVPIDRVLNVDAYEPGSYQQFYRDHRTRAEYLKWAPLLLACEDHYQEKAKKSDMRS